jgi:Uma2 family endonuclease
MATVNLIGLANHGQRVSDDEFEHADFEPGYKYELIDGRLYVSYEPDLPENSLEEWLNFKLKLYAQSHPEIVNFVSGKARVFVPGHRLTTCPEPDIALYQDFPHRMPVKQRSWRDVSPIIVIEVLVESDPFKDLVRNVDLYLQVPSIREYWILEGRDKADEPTLIAYRRRGRQWLKPREIEFGETYSTPLLPGFKLLVDPRR